MRVALVSLDQAWEDKAENCIRVAEHVDAAVVAGASLVVFPEMTLTGFSMAVESIGEDPGRSDTVAFFKKLASGRIAIAFGVVHLEGGKGVNKLVVIDREGQVLAEYRKIHPFSYGNEHLHYAPGDTLATFELEDLRIGCTVCYDLRFPALYQALARHCDVILNIANWPYRRVEHWDALLRARAIENQLFMVGVNRTGVDGNGLEYSRSTKVYDPWGESIQAIASNGTLDIVEVEGAAVRDARNILPVFSDRRDHLYSQFYDIET